MKTEKRLTMALSVLVALMMLAVPLASSSNLFVDGGQTNSNGDAPSLGASTLPSKNNYVEIKDVYVINSVEELMKLPIDQEWLKKQNGYKSDAELKATLPCLVTVYSVKDNVKGQNDNTFDSKTDYYLNFNVDYKNSTGANATYEGLSGLSEELNYKGNYYFIASLCKGSLDDKLDANNDVNPNQLFTVTAQIFENKTTAATGIKDVSMTSAVDNVTVLETWLINDQNSLDHMKVYGADPTKYVTEATVHVDDKDVTYKAGIWDPKRVNGNGNKPMSEPWIAVAVDMQSPGTVDINFTWGEKGETTITKSLSAGNHVITAYLANTNTVSTADEDRLDQSIDDAKNHEYVVSATGTDGSTSSKSVVYGNVSSTYDVIFKLNADETSLDLANKVGTISNVNGYVSWDFNADGDLVASVTIASETDNTKKVSVEYLITEIWNKLNRDGYTLTEWSSDDGNYTNMSYGTYSTANNNVNLCKDTDNPVKKNMTFTAIWELKEGWVETPVHVYQDDVLVGDFIKTYDIDEKNTILVSAGELTSSIKNATGINTYGIIVNDAAKSSAADVREVYSSKVTYGSNNDLPANSKIASNSELTVNYNLNDRLYSKVTIHSEAFKDGKDVTLFALKNKDYTYANVYYALQKESEKTHGIKAALELKDGGDLDKDKNATTSDNYYLLTGWNDGAELLDSSRNAPSELTLDTKLNGYYVIFMVNGQFEVVYIPFGELSADKCTIASGVKYWSYVSYADYENGVSNGEMKTFSFTKSQIDGIEKLVEKREHLDDPIAVFVGSAYSFNNTAYAVFDASANDGNFGNKYVDKMIVSGKASSGTTKTTISLPEVSPVYENTVVLVGYDGYTAIGDDASAFKDAGSAQTFTANVVDYKYTITFYNGSDVNGIFYYSDVSTMDSKDITSGLVAFSYKGTAYDANDLDLDDSTKDATKAYNNILFPAKDGYKLTQWKDSDGNVMLDKVKKETKEESNKNVTTITYEVKFKKVSSDMSFYANFEAQKFGIVYSGNTATATNNMVQVGSVDEALTLFKDSTFSNDGYKLTGWNTRPDGDGTSYKLGDSFSLNGAQFEDLSSIKGMDNVPADIEYGFTLYAIWEKVGASDNPGDNTDGSNDNTALYLIAGMLAVIAILAIVGIVLMRRK